MDGHSCLSSFDLCLDLLVGTTLSPSPPCTHQVEMEIVMPIEYTLKQVHDISLELQIKVWGDRSWMLRP